MNAAQRVPLLTGLFGTASMHAVFSDRACLQGLLDFEAALARSEAEQGIIPADAAEVIARHCDAGLYDLSLLGEGAAQAGNLAIPLVRALTARVHAENPDASGYVHWGATSQDAIDTGAMLQIGLALALVRSDLVRLIRALAELCDRERATVMAGRTWLQQAVPVTLGLKAAGWLDAALRHHERLAELEAHRVLQFGGAAGTLASLGVPGPGLAVALAKELRLDLPDLPWHTQRDRIAALAAGLGMLVGSLGKIARDISLLMQTEVAEAHEPIAPGRGGSSTMPHKRNPVASANILAAALRVPGLVSTVLLAMVQEHERGLGGWHAEWEVLPEIFRLCAGALAQSVEVIEGLGVDAPRMLANLGLTQGLPLAEAVTMALAPVLGRSTAHGLIEKASRKASALGLPLEEVLNEMPEVRKELAPERIRELLDPSRYLGSTQLFIDAVLARARGLVDEEAPCRPSN